MKLKDRMIPGVYSKRLHDYRIKRIVEGRPLPFRNWVYYRLNYADYYERTTYGLKTNEYLSTRYNLMG